MMRDTIKSLERKIQISQIFVKKHLSSQIYVLMIC